MLENPEWFSSNAGTRLAVGDLDGDRTADLAVGGSDRCSEDDPEIACEQVLVFRGGTTHLRPENHQIWAKESPGYASGLGPGAFGATLVIGDLDRDGHAGLVIGAPYNRSVPTGMPAAARQRSDRTLRSPAPGMVAGSPAPVTRPAVLKSAGPLKLRPGRTSLQ